MLSIEGRFFDAEMRVAAGDCFVQVGLPHGGWGRFEGRPIETGENYLRAAFHCAGLGGDAYCRAASYDIQELLSDNHLPVVGHIGLIPSCITWTGWRAVSKTVDEALALWRHTRKLEEVGAFAAELEVVPDRVAKFLTENSSLVMLGMGAGQHADAQYLFTEEFAATAGTTSLAMARSTETWRRDWNGCRRSGSRPSGNSGRMWTRAAIRGRSTRSRSRMMSLTPS